MRTIAVLVLFGLVVSCKPSPDLPDPFQAGWDGEKVCEILHETRKTRTLKCTFPPGVGHEKHYHAPHTGYTVHGSRFEMIAEDGVVSIVDVPAGFSWSKDEISIHKVLNVGDSTAVFIILEEK